MVFRVGLKRQIIGLFSLLLVAGPLQAAEDAFSIDKGFLWPEEPFYIRSQLISPSVFQNPSSISFADKGVAVKVASAQDYFGYGQTSVSFVVPSPFLTVGVGYHVFSADDIPSTSFDDAADYGVSVGDSLSDSIQELRFAFSKKLRSNLSASFVFSTYFRDLVGNNASAYSGDFGVSWIPSRYVALGVYSRHGFATQVDWVDLDEIQDDFSKKMVLEGMVSVSPVWAKVSSDMEYIRLESEFKLSSNFVILADAVNRVDDGAIRQGYGVLLELRPVSFYYYHLNFSGIPLSVSQDQLGLSFRISRS